MIVSSSKVKPPKRKLLPCCLGLKNRGLVVALRTVNVCGFDPKAGFQGSCRMR